MPSKKLPPMNAKAAQARARKNLRSVNAHQRFPDDDLRTTSTLTTDEKIEALVDFGLADDAEDARAQLVDMGELSEDDEMLDADPDDYPDGQYNFADSKVSDATGQLADMSDEDGEY